VLTHWNQVQYLFSRACLRSSCTLTSPNSNPPYLPQASQILAGLYISDIYTATSPQTLDAVGITHILSLYPEHFDYGKSAQMRFKSFWTPLYSPEQKDDLLQLLPITTYFLSGALADEARSRNRVLICCPYGIQDSPAIAIGYLIASHRMGFREALRRVREARPVVALSPNTREQLQQWEQMTRNDIERELEFRTRGVAKMGLGHRGGVGCSRESGYWGKQVTASSDR
jgi:atypical dual specificity phosphatase